MISDEHLEEAFEKMRIDDTIAHRVAELEKKVNLLLDIVGLLSRAENIRLERARKK